MARLFSYGWKPGHQYNASWLRTLENIQTGFSQALWRQFLGSPWKSPMVRWLEEHQTFSLIKTAALKGHNVLSLPCSRLQRQKLSRQADRNACLTRRNSPWSIPLPSRGQQSVPEARNITRKYFETVTVENQFKSKSEPECNLWRFQCCEIGAESSPDHFTPGENVCQDMRETASRKRG